METLKSVIRDIPDFPKEGIIFKDITPLLSNPASFKKSIDTLKARYEDKRIDQVVGVEARGFVFASAVSYILGKPFILLRKKNKLPAETHSVDFKLEYGTATIEVHKDSINKDDSVIVIDDLIATGGTAEAASKLIKISNGKVAGFVFVINLFDLGGYDKLIKQGYKVKSLIDFPGH